MAGGKAAAEAGAVTAAPVRCSAWLGVAALAIKRADDKRGWERDERREADVHERLYSGWDAVCVERRPLTADAQVGDAVEHLPEEAGCGRDDKAGEPLIFASGRAVRAPQSQKSRSGDDGIDVVDDVCVHGV